MTIGWGPALRIFSSAINAQTAQNFLPIFLAEEIVIHSFPMEILLKVKTENEMTN